MNKEKNQAENADSKDEAKGVTLEDPAPPEVNEAQQFRAERDELKELLLRRQAEFDNFRKRTERERTEHAQFASMEVARELIPVLDDFERALKADGGSSDYARGVELIYNRLLDSISLTSAWVGTRSPVI